MFQKPVIAVSTQDVSAKLGELRVKAGELRLRASDLEVRKSQLGDQLRRLGEQRRGLGADVDHSAIDKQLAAVEHELASTHIQLESVNHQIEEMQVERDMARAFSLQNAPGQPGAPIAIAAPPSPPMLGPREIITIWTGGVVLLLPFAVVLARRLWVRGSRREVLDLENSPRLQRIEQAVEAIALEVERIGEAQRFTTKLLAERQADPAPRLSVPARREPGTITPH